MSKEKKKKVAEQEELNKRNRTAKGKSQTYRRKSGEKRNKEKGEIGYTEKKKKEQGKKETEKLNKEEEVGVEKETK